MHSAASSTPSAQTRYSPLASETTRPIIPRVRERASKAARCGSVSPSAAAAYAAGQGLARTHQAGATAFGAPPRGWSGDGYLGPLSEPLPLALGTHPRWGAFYADERLRPVIALGRERGVFDAADAVAVEGLADRLHVGDFDTDDPPARLHGDLWSGNLMWTPNGAVVANGHPG